MPNTNEHLWGIVLAGGEGKRLKQFVRSRFNADTPKQYCTFTGTRSMLSHTISRALLSVSPERLMVIVNEEHLNYAERDVRGLDKRNIVVQPFSRETSASILLPLLHVHRRDPDALVAIFPSDHYIKEEARFMEHVLAAAAFTERHRKFLVLLGVRSEEFRSDYGWIEAGMRIAELNGCEIFRVKRFIEKPDARKMSKLQRDQTFLNTMVMVGVASAVLRKFRLVAPVIYRAFKRIDAELFSPNEARMVGDVYSELPNVDFSHAILQHDPQGLAVLRVEDVYWNDWGDATRIQADVARFG